MVSVIMLNAIKLNVVAPNQTDHDNKMNVLPQLAAPSPHFNLSGTKAY
jgi:hypothetical protein